MAINKLKLNVVCDSTKNMRGTVASLVLSADDGNVRKSAEVILKQLDNIDKRANVLFNTKEKASKVAPAPEQEPETTE